MPKTYEWLVAWHLRPYKFLGDFINCPAILFGAKQLTENRKRNRHRRKRKKERGQAPAYLDHLAQQRRPSLKGQGRLLHQARQAGSSPASRHGCQEASWLPPCPLPATWR